jgi:hypothetical protein
MNLRYLTRMLMVLFLATGVAMTASAQYTGGGTAGGGTMPGTTYNNGSGYGHGAAIAVGVGAAAAVAGIVLYVHHKHSVKASRASISGCTQVADHRAILLDDTDKRVYSLANTGEYLKTGERVDLAGYKSTDSSGTRVFTVQSLVNDWGSCRSQATLLPERTLSSGQGGQR